MKQAELKVEPRTTGKKSLARALRRNGRVPANFYGPGIDNATCDFDSRDLARVLKTGQSGNIMLTLKSEDSRFEGKKVLIKTVDRDPVSWRPVHADLYSIDMTRALTVDIPLVFEGVPEGVKVGGGILNIIRRSVQIRALPNSLPESIKVDITGVKLGENLHVSDLPLSEDWKLVDSASFTLLSVNEPEKEEVKVAAPAATAEGGEAPATGDAAAAAAPAEEKKS